MGNPDDKGPEVKAPENPEGATHAKKKLSDLMEDFLFIMDKGGSQWAWVFNRLRRELGVKSRFELIRELNRKRQDPLSEELVQNLEADIETLIDILYRISGIVGPLREDLKKIREDYIQADALERKDALVRELGEVLDASPIIDFNDLVKRLERFSQPTSEEINSQQIPSHRHSDVYFDFRDGQEGVRHKFGPNEAVRPLIIDEIEYTIYMVHQHPRHILLIGMMTRYDGVGNFFDEKRLCQVGDFHQMRLNGTLKEVIINKRPVPQPPIVKDEAPVEVARDAVPVVDKVVVAPAQPVEENKQEAPSAKGSWIRRLFGK